jgi:sec-independent protein translocase protein TatB
MFDFSWSHMIVIAIVALVVIGPKELPAVLRTAGQWMGKVRRMASEFQGQFQEALREAEMADLKQHFDDISTAAKDLPHFDPVSTVRKEIQQATSFSSLSRSPAATPDSPAAAGAPPAAGAPAEPVAGEAPAAVLPESGSKPDPQPSLSQQADATAPGPAVPATEGLPK